MEAVLLIPLQVLMHAKSVWFLQYITLKIMVSLGISGQRIHAFNYPGTMTLVVWQVSENKADPSCHEAHH